MAWIVNDIKSLLPSNPPTLSPEPQVGQQAPASSLKLGDKSVVVFLRQLQTQRVVDYARKYPDVTYHLVFHAEDSEIEEYKQEIKLGPIPANVRFIGDVPRLIYAAYGIGELSWGGVFSRDVLSKAGELRKEGIKNTLTIGNRWQNNGAFAIDGDHVIRWKHIARNAADTSNVEEATEALNRRASD